MKYAKYIENFWFLKVSIVLQISPQRNLQSLLKGHLRVIIIIANPVVISSSPQNSETGNIACYILCLCLSPNSGGLDEMTSGLAIIILTLGWPFKPFIHKIVFFTIFSIEVSNFIKIRAFVAEIFAKQYWLSNIINF